MGRSLSGFIWRHIVRNVSKDSGFVVWPALMRYDGSLHFTKEDPILSYLPDSIKGRAGPGISGVKKFSDAWILLFRFVWISCLPLVHGALMPILAFLFLHFKSEAIFSPHRQANFVNRQTFTFEIHGATAVGKIRLPGNVIVVAFMTSNGHGICAISAIRVCIYS